MLKPLFSSVTRVKLLRTFLLNPDEEYFIRELTRKLDEQINSIRRELDNLKKIGLLRSRVRNRKKYYYVNTDFIIFNELRDIFIKADGNDQELVKKLTKMGQVDFLLLSGLFVNKEESAVDLLIVGDLDKTQLEKYLAKLHKGDRQIKFSLMTQKDFLYRLECNDKFVYDLLRDEKSLVLINKLKKELDVA